jgi:hypothetical protein
MRIAMDSTLERGRHGILPTVGGAPEATCWKGTSPVFTLKRLAWQYRALAAGDDPKTKEPP